MVLFKTLSLSLTFCAQSHSSLETCFTINFAERAGVNSIFPAVYEYIRDLPLPSSLRHFQFSRLMTSHVLSKLGGASSTCITTVCRFVFTRYTVTGPCENAPLQFPVLLSS